MDFVSSVQESLLFVNGLKKSTEESFKYMKLLNKEKEDTMNYLENSGLVTVTKFCDTEEEMKEYKKKHPKVNCVVLSKEETERIQKEKYDEEVLRCERNDAEYVVSKCNDDGKYKKIEPFIFSGQFLVSQNSENLCEFYIFKLCGCVGKFCMENEKEKRFGYHVRCDKHLTRYSMLYDMHEMPFMGVLKARMNNKKEYGTRYCNPGRDEYTFYPDGTYTCQHFFR